MNLDAILSTVALIGSNLPAYKALFDQAVALLEPSDQETAQAAYAKALGDAKAAHEAAQGL